VHMWDTFWPDVLVAIIGAALTVFIALATYLVRARIEENRALQSLVNELHRRRALAPGADVPIPGAASLDDYLRANASILSIKDEIRLVRDRVRDAEKLQEPLASMTRACNHYLEASSRYPERYAILLNELRAKVAKQVIALSRLRRAVRPLVPGDGAF